MTTQPDQDKTIHCKEFQDLMTEFRHADYSNINPLDAYDAVVAYVNEKRPPLPDQDQMTLRDQFAMAALDGLINLEYNQIMANESGSISFEEVAKNAYQLADALMNARQSK